MSLPTQTPQNKQKRRNLSSQAIRIIHDVGAYKFMTGEQLHRLRYPNDKNYRNATTRLSELADTIDTGDHEAAQTFDSNRDGFLSHVWLREKVTIRPGMPRRVFYLAPHNLVNIQEAYRRRAKLSQFDNDFGDIKPTIKKNKMWAAHTMEHELLITDYAIALTSGTLLSQDQTKDRTDCTDHKKTLLFWERTSPSSQEISETFIISRTNAKTRQREEKSVNFNPDMIECVLNIKEASTNSNPSLNMNTSAKAIVYLSAVELDNDTELLDEQFLPKVEAYDEHIRKNRVSYLLYHYVKKHNLKRMYPILADHIAYEIAYRIRIVTTSARRRNALLRLIATKSRYPQAYHLTTLDELTNNHQGFYTTAHWLPAAGYVPIKVREQIETKGMTTTALRQWRDAEIVEHIRPVGYFYRHV